MRLSVRYRRHADLVRDHDEQFVRGGLLIQVNPPDNLQRGTAVELDLVVPDGTVLPVDATVIQAFPTGLAIGFDARTVPGLTEAVAVARAAGGTSAAGPAAPPEHRIITGESPDQDPADDLAAEQPTADEASAPPRGVVTARKIQQALHGNRDERAAILRDLNKMLHPYVLRNPGLGLDEVLGIAKMTTIAPEVLKTICDRRDWAQRPDIALALVRNPKTPIPLAVKLLAYVAASDLRMLAKDARTRAPIQQAARKRVIDGQ